MSINQTDSDDPIVDGFWVHMADLQDELNEEKHPKQCRCVDCVGDFSGASEDTDWGGR